MVLPLLGLAAAGWFVLLIVAPVLPIPLAGTLYAIGSVICHQKADRSFHLFAAQLPVCARCLGIYAGAAVAVASAAAMPFARDRIERVSSRVLLVAGAAPTVITLALEWSGTWAGSNAIRAAAGVPAGIAVALVVVQAAATLHYDGCAQRRPSASNRPPTPT